MNPWLQWGGFLLGVALMAWCVRLVAADETRMAQLGRLLHAPGTLAAMLALSAGCSLSVGMLFRATLTPVTRLPVMDALAVNAIATLLNVLPFKLSLVARGYLHRVRNGVPVPLTVAWMVATAGVMAASLLPPLLATLMLRRIDAVWWAVCAGGTAALAVGAVVFARITGRDGFWKWLEGVGERWPRSVGRVTKSSVFADLRRGPEMLGSIPAVAQGVAWRTVSMGFGVWRFAVAAGAVGAVMTVGQCVVADSTYFTIQAGAPTGALGAREGGTAAVMATLAGDSLPVVVLAVTAAETGANLLLAAVGAIYLRLTTANAKNTTGEPG